MTTFRRKTTVHDRATDTVSHIDTAILGLAVRVRGDTTRYRDLGLIERDAPTLLFTPKEYGDRIDVGDTVEWPPDSGDEYTVRDVSHIEPDGVVITSRAICVR